MTMMVSEVRTEATTEKKDPSSVVVTHVNNVVKSVSTQPKLKRHKRYYMPDGNIIIQVENTLFKLGLSILHENSPVLRSTVPPLKTGMILPIVGYNDRRPIILREVAEVDFTRLCSILYPSPGKPMKKFNTVDALISILKLARSFEMGRVRDIAMNQLHELSIDPIRKIAIWDEFHLDSDLLLPSFTVLCQRSEPLTLPMTMSLGIRNFTKVAASRDLYRQRVGCCGCRTSLSVEESQKIADEIVADVFTKRPSTRLEKSLL